MTQIDKDLPRTFPTHSKLGDPEYQKRIKRILIAITNCCTDVGYVQGMNSLVGYLLLYCKEQNVFILMTRLMKRREYCLSELFKEGLPQISVLTKQFQKMLKVFIYLFIFYLFRKMHLK